LPVNSFYFDKNQITSQSKIKEEENQLTSTTDMKLQE